MTVLCICWRASS